MSMGYIDPVTKKYVKTAGDMSSWNTPTATPERDGLMSSDQAQKLENAYSPSDVATNAQIDALFA